MSFKSIVVPFLEKSAAQSAFETAASVAAWSKAHLHAVHLRQRPSPPTVAYYPLGGAYPPIDAPSFLEAEEAHANELKALFQAACEAHKIAICDIDQHRDEQGASASWSDLHGDAPEILGRFAAARDLAVMSLPAGPFAGALEHAAETLIFRSGRPLLAAPPGAEIKPDGHLLIAWNGKAEAARAVAAAMALIEAAARVTIVSIREHGGAALEPEPLAAALKLHGVDAACVDLDLPRGESALQAFDHEIADLSPDLAVMGAYSHSRWREAVLGGFTRHMLRGAKVPVLLAH